jgi:serine/threonine-protein kinase RsbW
LNTHAQYHAHLDELHRIQHWIRENLRSLGLDEIAILKLELACEEAIVNIIQHGYKGKGGLIDLDIRGGKRIEIEFQDSAPSFNPLEKKVTYDSSAPLEERKAGGLGILIIRQYVDDWSYKREAGKNVFTLIKQL